MTRHTGQRVFDHAHWQSVLALAIGTGEDLAGIRAVGQQLVHGQLQVGLDAPQQPGTAGAGLAPQRQAVKAAVGQQQLIGLQPLEQERSQCPLALRAGTHFGVADSVCAALSHSHPAPLRDGAAVSRGTG